MKPRRFNGRRIITTPLGPAYMWGPMDYHGAFRPKEGPMSPTPANPTSMLASMSLMHDGDFWTWDVSTSVPYMRDDGTRGRVIRKALGSHRVKEVARREALDALGMLMNPDTTVFVEHGRV